MKNFKILLAFIAASFVLSSCYKEQDWLADNSTTEDRYFPVIQKIEIDPTSVAPGDTSTLTVYYWSHDPIKELELWASANGTDSLVTTWQHTDSFNEEAYAEVTALDYIAPNFADTTDVKLKVVVRNENGLEREKSGDITVNP